MSGDSYLADSNILIYILEGNPAVKLYLDNSFWISEISEIELLGMNGISSVEIAKTKAIIDDCYVFEMTAQVKDIAISIRQKNKIKLPDAIIAATAIYLNLPLLTADKDFKKIPNLDVVMINL